MIDIATRMRLAIRHRRTIRQNVHVGENFRFDQRSYIWAPQRLDIGDNVSVGSDVRIEVDGTIGDCVLIANSVGIVGRTDHEIDRIGVPIRDTRWVGNSPEELSRPVLVGSDVWLGFRATILSGVVVGDCSVIGAGAVVTRSIPENSIAVGNPARVVGQRFSAKAFEDHWAALEKLGVRRLASRSMPSDFDYDKGTTCG